MTAVFLETLAKLGVRFEFVDKGFSRSIDEVGVPGKRKVMRLAQLAGAMATRAIRHRDELMIYLVAANKSGFLADAMVMTAYHLCGGRYWLYFHGRGYRELAAQNTLWSALVSRVLRRARGGIVLSRRLVQDVVPWLPERRLMVIPNVIEMRPFPIREPRTDGTVHLLYLANLIPSKGAMEFVQAAKVVSAIRPNARFRIAGKASNEQFRARLEGEIRGAEGTITLIGPIYGEAKEQLFANSDVFVFPTYYAHETFGLVNLEAMRAGLPVIATDIGGVGDVVIDGETGFLVPPRSVDALVSRMIRLIDDPALRDRMGHEGRRHFEESFSPHRFALRWRLALEAMARENTEPPTEWSLAP